MTTRQALWDVQKYRNHYDSEEVWQLKEAFLMKHRTTIPEDDLVCLAQTLVNIEVLKCRYSPALMKRVESLAADILTEYREKRGNRLKRTFVSASAAAMYRVTRTEGVPPESTEQTLPVPLPSCMSYPIAGPSLPNYDAVMKEEEELATGKCRKRNRRSKKNKPYDHQNHYPVATTLPSKYGREDPFLGEFGRMLIFDEGSATSKTIISRLASMCRIQITESEIIQNDEWYVAEIVCFTHLVTVQYPFRKVDISIGSKVIATATGILKKKVRATANDKALEELQLRYYTLRVKMRHIFQGMVLPPKTEKKRKKEEASLDKTTNDFQDNKLGENNVGFRLLKSLGWSGGGLGQLENNRQAIVEPIGVTMNCGRRGIGCQVSKEVTFRRYIQDILKNFASSNDFYDLQFDTSFTKEEREEIHKAAIPYNLKAKSRNIKGASGEALRRLIISKNTNIFEIAQILLSVNPDPVLSQKYELIPPKGRVIVVEEE